MKYLRQLSIIFLISLISELLNSLIDLPIPASVYGIVILFLLLLCGAIRVEQIKEVSSFLIEAMPLMFIPAVAGLMESFGLLIPDLTAYIVIIVVSTVAVMAVSGLVTQSIMLRKGGRKDDNA